MSINNQNSQDPFSKAFENSETIEKFESYEETFKPKLYHEKYEGTAKNMGTVSYWLNGFSVATGVIGLAAILAYLIWDNIYIMAVPALLLLALCEAGKRKTVREFFISKFGSKKIDKGALLGVILCVFFSLACTVGGGWYVASIANAAKAPKMADTKAIEKKFDAKISQVRKDKKVLIDRNTYKGQTWLNAENQAIDAGYIAKIEALEKDQKAAIITAKKENVSKLVVHAKGGIKYIMLALLVSLIIEALSFFSLWFPLYFQHRSLRDKKTLTKVFRPQLTNWQLQEVTRVLGLDLGQLLGNNAAPVAMPVGSTPTPTPTQQPVTNEPIGFRQVATTPNTPKSQPRPPRGKAIDYHKVYVLLDNGLSVAEIATAMKCSESSVRTAKRERERGNPM